MSTNMPSQPVGVPPLGSATSTPSIGVGPNALAATPALEGEIVDPLPSEDAGDPVPQEMINRRGYRRLEKISAENLEEFLKNLALTGLLYKSAECVGLAYATIKRLQKQHPEFLAMCDEAMQDYREMLHQEVHRRAVDGWDEPVFSQRLGTQIGVVRKYDTRLMEMLIKRHDPAFREKQEVAHTGMVGVLVAPITPVSEEDWEKRFGGARHELAAPPGGGTLPDDSEKK